jgi:hypothetical protein
LTHRGEIAVDLTIFLLPRLVWSRCPKYRASHFPLPIIFASGPTSTNARAAIDAVLHGQLMSLLVLNVLVPEIARFGKDPRGLSVLFKVRFVLRVRATKTKMKGDAGKIEGACEVGREGQVPEI